MQHIEDEQPVALCHYKWTLRDVILLYIIFKCENHYDNIRIHLKTIPSQSIVYILL